MAVTGIRIHGRGGQGVVTAARILAPALYQDGHNIQAIPEFGVERRGAPVASYIKYADTRDEIIPARTYVHDPDYIICMDESLFDSIDVTDGLQPDGAILINTEKAPEEFDVDAATIGTVDARRIGRDVFGKNIVNTILLGSFAAMTGAVSLESVSEAIEEKFDEQNVTAAHEGFKQTTTVSRPVIE